MAVLYITEFADAGMNFPTVATQPPLAEQKVTFTTSTASAAFNAKTSLVRIHTDSICSIEFVGAGALAVATTSTARMAANQTEYFIVPRGQGYSVAAVTNT